MSDYFRRRKELILLGYGMSALTKPLFPLATSAETVFVARFLDRIGKGIRGAPRTRWSPMSLPRRFAGPASVFVSRWIPLGRFLGRRWRYC